MRRRLGVALCAAAWLPLGGCLVENGRCGPHQEHSVSGNCVCVSGFIPNESAVCTPCGENSVSEATQCRCAPGFVRGASGACEMQSASFGAACATDADCSAGAPYCLQDATHGYCTVRDCSGTEGCPGGFGCDAKRSPPVCVRAPTGLNDACTKPEDCASKEASYCEQVSSKTCQVSGCKQNADCFANYECCNLTPYGLPTLCVPGGSCPVP